MDIKIIDIFNTLKLSGLECYNLKKHKMRQSKIPIEQNKV